MNLISFSLYGMDPIYTQGAIENAKLAPVYYGKDWTARFYCGAEVTKDIIDALRGYGAQAIAMPHEINGPVKPWIGIKKGQSKFGPFWRFLAASDPQATWAVFRDVDSRLNIREAVAVRDWIASGKLCLSMKDHVNHGCYQLLAGMWGIKCRAVDMQKLLNEWGYSGLWYDDQVFLEQKVWPLIAHSAVCYGRYPWQGSPFPAHPPMYGFVGQRIHPNGHPMHD